jgi:hypothetical protein
MLNVAMPARIGSGYLALSVAVVGLRGSAASRRQGARMSSGSPSARRSSDAARLRRAHPYPSVGDRLRARDIAILAVVALATLGLIALALASIASSYG